MNRLENGLIVQPDPQVVAIADDVGKELHEYLRQKGFETRELINSKDPNTLVDRLKGAHIVVTRTSSDFRDPRVVEEMDPDMIQGACKGPHANVNVAKTIGKEVLKADTNANEVAAVVNASLYAAASGYTIGGHQLDNDKWDKKEAGLSIFPLRESTLGLVGLGNVGQTVVESLNIRHRNIVRPTVGEVVAYNHRFEHARKWDDTVDRFSQEHGIQRATSLEELLDRASILSLHVDVTDALGNSNVGMVTEDMLREWGKKHRTPDGRPRAVFINAGRGELAPDIHVLNKLLHERVLHSAHVDAHPAAMEAAGKFKSPTDKHPGLHYTPHIGGSGDHIDAATAVEVDETLTRWVRTGGHPDKSRIYVHQPMDTSEVVDQGGLVIRAVRSTIQGSDEALKHGISSAGFSLLHPGVTFGDRIPGTKDDIKAVPTVLSVNINGTDPQEACERIAEGIDRSNQGSQRVIALRFIPTTEEMRQGVRAFANRNNF